jgi:hypothetical protein
MYIWSGRDINNWNHVYFRVIMVVILIEVSMGFICGGRIIENGLGLFICTGTFDFVGILFGWHLKIIGLDMGVTSHGDVFTIAGTSGSAVITASRFSPGLAAKTVILILQACEGRILWRLDRISQFFHSSSTNILAVPLLRKAHLR